MKYRRQEKTFEFPGASASEAYEVLDKHLYLVERRMQLEGRVNVILEGRGARSTEVTVTARYGVTRTLNVKPFRASPFSYTHTLAFNSGQSAEFPATTVETRTKCVPTGRLEREILDPITH